MLSGDLYERSFRAVYTEVNARLEAEIKAVVHSHLRSREDGSRPPPACQDSTDRPRSRPYGRSRKALMLASLKQSRTDRT